MAKLITFKAPVSDKGKISYVDMQGYVCRLPVGDTEVKFVLQVGGLDGKPEYLTHYASGWKLPGSLNEVRVAALVRWGTSSARLTDREAARRLLAGHVDRLGAEAIMAKLKAAPVINK